MLFYYLLFPKEAARIADDRRRRQELLSQFDPSMQGKYMFRELNREIRLAQERRKALLERLWMGAFGGVALIGPMLLMVLHRGLNTSVITATVATGLFTIVISINAKDLGGKDILATVAAYAAVLVVFVGTSLTADSS